MIERLTAFSAPGQFAPRNETANRTLANSLRGTFAQGPFCSLAHLLHGPVAPWSEMAQELSFSKTFDKVFFAKCTCTVYRFYVTLHCMF